MQNLSWKHSNSNRYVIQEARLRVENKPTANRHRELKTASKKEHKLSRHDVRVSLHNEQSLERKSDHLLSKMDEKFIA